MRIGMRDSNASHRSTNLEMDLNEPFLTKLEMFQAGLDTLRKLGGD
jgi:hypothetical protein